MKQYVEKRYEQVSAMFPAYPDIVWLDEWLATSDQWIDGMEAALLPWAPRLAELRLRVGQALVAHAVPAAGVGAGAAGPRERL